MGQSADRGWFPWHSSLMGGAGVSGPPTSVGCTHGASERGARRRGDVELDDLPAGHGVGEPRQGVADLGRRRHRVRRPARRLRRDARRPRPPARSSRPCSAAWRSARTSPSRPRTAIVVAEKLAERFGLPLWRFGNSRHRGDDGRRPPDAGDHRARSHRQDRGQLPRPPRRGDGVDVPRRRRARPVRAAASSVARARASRRRWSTSCIGRAVQRPRRARARARPSTTVGSPA